MWESEQDWLRGKGTLGAATKWTSEEIRLVSELGYGLAEQGRTAEAITLFEGLAALTPATIYFQSALGALWLRERNPQRALFYLDKVLEAEPNDVISLVNRGEAHLLLAETDAARKDFQTALSFKRRNGRQGIDESIEEKSLIRARALLGTAERRGLEDAGKPKLIAES